MMSGRFLSWKRLFFRYESALELGDCGGMGLNSREALKDHVADKVKVVSAGDKDEI